jgi:DmsE family decaheme c-type cytochrome
MREVLRWTKMKRASFIAAFLVALASFIGGCESLKKTTTLYSIKEYERMIVGRLDADYVGTDTCLTACHVHDDLRKNFDASTMGIQLSKDSGLPLVNCESCHGPGSLAVAGLTPEMVESDRKSGVKTKCRNETLINIKKLPAPAQSLICLKCHTGNASFNLHDWTGSTHNIDDVSCSECHSIHAGPNLRVELNETAEMCERCHQEVKAEFSLRSHHPVKENKIFCTDCHDPHGSTADYLLREMTIKDTCGQCHADKTGPSVFEHAENMEDCTNCHNPHGSVNSSLLKLREPFLCLQCHSTHRTSETATNKSVFFTRCTDCHSQIHGTDLPSASGNGRFIH